MNGSGSKVTCWKDLYGKEFPDFSGEGFAYINNKEPMPLYFEVTVPEASLYKISMKCVQVNDQGGRKQTIQVNGKDYLAQMPYSEKWITLDFGMVKFIEGKNNITILNKIGYMMVDYVTVEEVEFPDFKEADSVPVDKEATKETKNVMKYLHSIYGDHIISGQEEIYGGGHGGKDYDFEFNFIKNLTGKFPAIRAFDFAVWNNMYGWDSGVTDRAIEWWEKGGLLTACYHLNLPTNWDSYKVGEKMKWNDGAFSVKPLKAFKVKNAVIEGTKENDFINANLEIIANKLLEMQKKGVVVLFRPLHEAEGNPGEAWFWWGQEGPEAFKDLWIYYYKTLTETYGVHNLIWLLNLYTWNEDSAKWYPGDEYVDMVGYDKYNVQYNRHDGKNKGEGPNLDAEASLFWGLNKIVKNKKMICLPEIDSLPSLDNIKAEHTAWIFFSIWYDGESTPKYVTSSDFNEPQHLIDFYNSDYCITLDELPDFRN